MRTFNVRFDVWTKVDGGPKDYATEYVAEVDVPDGDWDVDAVRLYALDEYDNGDGPAIPEEAWPKHPDPRRCAGELYGWIVLKAFEQWSKGDLKPDKE